MMKKSVFILVAMAMLSVKGFSQEKKTKFSIDPLQLGVFNILNFEYERSFNEGNLGVAFYYGNAGATAGKFSIINHNTMNYSEQSVLIKKYIKSFDSSGWWYGGQLSFASFDNIVDDQNIVGEDYVINAGTMGVSAKGGYQFVLNSFYINLHTGIGYALTNKLYGDVYYGENVTETKWLIPYGIKMGIIF